MTIYVLRGGGVVDFWKTELIGAGTTVVIGELFYLLGVLVYLKPAES